MCENERREMIRGETGGIWVEVKVIKRLRTQEGEKWQKKIRFGVRRKGERSEETYSVRDREGHMQGSISKKRGGRAHHDSSVCLHLTQCPCFCAWLLY